MLGFKSHLRHNTGKSVQKSTENPTTRDLRAPNMLKSVLSDQHFQLIIWRMQAESTNQITALNEHSPSARFDRGNLNTTEIRMV